MGLVLWLHYLGTIALGPQQRMMLTIIKEQPLTHYCNRQTGNTIHVFERLTLSEHYFL